MEGIGEKVGFCFFSIGLLSCCVELVVCFSYWKAFWRGSMYILGWFLLNFSCLLVRNGGFGHCG